MDLRHAICEVRGDTYPSGTQCIQPARQHLVPYASFSL